MTIRLNYPVVALALLALSTLDSQLSTALAQGTAFTYQGQLMDAGAPANGLYDIRAGLYATDRGGSLITDLDTNSAVAVSNGLFTITLDFGDVFDGAPLWLQIGVRTNGAGADFTSLSSRQELTSTPYAIFAAGANAAGLTGTIPMASLTGTYGGALDLTNTGNSFAGNGAGLTNVNAATLGGLASSSFWETAGNGGTSPAKGNFVGTVDNNPLELRVSGTRALRLEPTPNDANHSNIVNVVGGAAVNFVGAGIYGGTIAGGGANNYFGSPLGNSVIADFGTVGGGSGNIAGGSDNYYTTPLLGYSTVGGGVSNSATGTGSFVGGGGYGAGIFAGNVASGDASVVGGGLGNTASGGQYGFTTVGGGYGNTATYSYATVAGGAANSAELNDATVGGGARNTANGFGATVAGGFQNLAGGQGSTVAGGSDNTASGIGYGFSTVGGGYDNIASDYATVGGGAGNSATNDDTTVAGGVTNAASGYLATVGGGGFNTASGDSAVVPGGSGNKAHGVGSFAAGLYAQALHNDCFVWSDGEGSGYYSSDRANQFKIQAGGGMVLDVSGSSGLNPAAFRINSTSANGSALYIIQGSTDSTAGFANTGTGDLIRGWSGPSAGTLAFRVANDGTVYVKGVALTSDRNAKENFTPLNAQTLLSQLAALPITLWNYKDDSCQTRHIGPVAQDFHAAFGLNGADEKHISTVDEGGVALAAIQGLNQKVESENSALRAENVELRRRLEALEKVVLGQESNEKD
jgi:hypothetical protein